MKIFSLLAAALLLLFLVGCEDAYRPSAVYTYRAEPGFIVMTVYSNEKIYNGPTAIAIYNITSVEQKTTMSDESSYVQIFLADGTSRNLYDLTTREFFALSSEAAGPWIFSTPQPNTERKLLNED